MSLDTSSGIEVSVAPAHELKEIYPRSITWSQVLGDYVQLTKPRILVMILLTVGVAIVAVPNGDASFWVFLHAVLGTGLVAASASVLNQWIEREQDALMPRTAKRPLPDGRLTPFEAAVLGFLLVVMGTVYLFFMTNPLTSLIGLITWGLYVWIYTPMKRLSWWNTAVGTLPGALPVLMGWTAAGGRLDQWGGWLLTSIVVLWQFPHFMSIAWLYREQYGQAGYRMLTNVEPTGRWAAWHALIPAISLIPLSYLVLHPVSSWDWILFALSVVTCAGQISASWAFMKERSTITARRLLRSSLLFLPAILTLVVVRSYT